MTVFGTSGARRRGGLLALALAVTTVTPALFAGPAQAAQRTGPSAVSHAPAGLFVVTSPEGSAAAAAAVRAAHGTVTETFPLAGAVGASLPAGAVLPAGTHAVPNRSFKVAASGTSDSAAVSTVRATLGLGAPHGEGAGTTVAVVDTGVADVPDLTGRLTHVNVTGDPQADGYGHGTFVAGLVGGDGRSSGGQFAGIAPGANILDVKVGRADGSSDLVTVLRGLQAVDRNGKVSVLNLSLSSESPLPYQLDPLDAALENLWRRGVVVVVPAGNNGDSGAGSVTSPGTDPVLMTVGGIDEAGTASRTDDTVSDFSGQGPTRDGIAKPDLVAPASHMISLAAPGSAIDTANPGSRVTGGYFRGSGTSFSTAVASGAAAVLAANKDTKNLSPQGIKSLLADTAYPVPGGTFVAGAGGLDLAGALAAPKRKDQADKADLPPGQDNVWAALNQAGIDGDEAAAARNWALLSPEARNWAARNWAALTPEARNWVARNWTDSTWVDAVGTDGGWAARSWAASTWAARNWTARSWTARNWTGGDWVARSWAESDWSARSWAARSWAARNWTARSWTSADWAGTSWSGRMWAGASWSDDDWSGACWSSDEWSARSWTARAWTARSWS